MNLPDMVLWHVKLPKQLVKDLKHYCIDHEITAAEFIRDAIAARLSEARPVSLPEVRRRGA